VPASHPSRLKNLHEGTAKLKFDVLKFQVVGQIAIHTSPDLASMGLFELDHAHQHDSAVILQRYPGD